MNSVRFAVDNAESWRWNALRWATTQHAFVMWFASNGIEYPNNPFPDRLCIGAKRVVSFADGDAFSALFRAHRADPAFLVGYFGYDLKNQLEALDSRHPDRLGFPEIYFAEPEWVIDVDPAGIVTVWGDGDVQSLRMAIDQHSFQPLQQTLSAVQCRVSRADYLANVERIRQYIKEGEVYELNYCVEFFAENVILDPVATYEALTRRSPMPFSTFLKLDNRYLMGASPERFLKKSGNRLISQPIKGTIRRGQSPEEDERLRTQLLNSEKERAENLMIVDLVRNDLARSGQTGSVRVEELFGIYTFRQVHQMISTVSATLREGVAWSDAIKYAFPMGSMTGAPKIRAMELIDELEASRRGLFSGAIGFVTPDGDFDFNVVIRSLQYTADSRYASFSVGSAITYDADPAQEWDECLLKAQAIRSILEPATTSVTAG